MPKAARAFLQRGCELLVAMHHAGGKEPLAPATCPLPTVKPFNKAALLFWQLSQTRGLSDRSPALSAPAD